MITQTPEARKEKEVAHMELFSDDPRNSAAQVTDCRRRGCNAARQLPLALRLPTKGLKLLRHSGAWGSEKLAVVAAGIDCYRSVKVFMHQ